MPCVVVHDLGTVVRGRSNPNVDDVAPYPEDVFSRGRRIVLRSDRRRYRRGRPVRLHPSFDSEIAASGTDGRRVRHLEVVSGPVQFDARRPHGLVRRGNRGVSVRDDRVSRIVGHGSRTVGSFHSEIQSDAVSARVAVIRASVHMHEQAHA